MFLMHLITARVVKRAKVMFSRASVCPTPGGVDNTPLVTGHNTCPPPPPPPPPRQSHSTSRPGHRSQHFPPGTMHRRAVRILLECILVTYSGNSQGNLNDIEIEYRVEHQAKFLLKTQQAPTLRWFSSQDGLDKLFEKSQISSDTTTLTEQHDFEKLSSNQSGPPPTSDDNNDGLIGTVATPFPSITDASSVPEINVLGVYHRTIAQASSSSELLTDTNTSLRSEGNETPSYSQVCDQISVQSTSLDISSEGELLEHDENTHDNVRWSGNSTTDSCVEGPVIQSQDCQTTLFALQQRKELTQTKSEPKLVHCSEDKLPGSSNSDTHRQEAVAVRSAPILPSERTVFKTDDNIILLVEGQKVHVSKVLLSLHSEFFKAMFATDMKESQQSEIG